MATQRRRLPLLTVLLLLLAAFLGLVQSQPAAADQLSVTAAADTYVDQNAPTSTAGGTSTTLQIAQATKLKRALLRFDVTDIPAGATGVTATVDLTTRTSMTKTIELHALNAAQTFAEATTNWNNQPTFAAAALSTKCCLATGVRFTMAAGNVTGNGTWYFAVVNKTTQNGSESVQAREGTPDADDPKLTVSYTPAAATTTTTTAPACEQASSYASPQAAVDGTPVGGCLDINADYNLTTSVNVNKDITVNCLTAGTGFHATSGTFPLLNVSASGVTVDGCDLDGPGGNTGITGVDLSASISNVLLDNLTATDLNNGVLSAAASTQSAITVEDSTITTTWRTGIGFYNTSATTVSLLRNTISDTQNSGITGNAAIQTGGSTTNRYHNWTVSNNVVDNTGPCVVGASSQVSIGLDQIADSTIQANKVISCTGPSEGIVVNGPNNQILGDANAATVDIEGVGNGAVTLISYGNAAQHVQGVTVADLVIHGPGSGPNQGIALSFPSGADPITGLRVLRNTISNQNYGIQAYSSGGSILAGSDNLIQDNTLSGNISGPCSLPAPFAYSSVSNVPGC